MLHSGWPQECLDPPLGSQDLGRPHSYLGDHGLLWTSWTIQGPSGDHGVCQIFSEWVHLRSLICICGSWPARSQVLESNLRHTAWAGAWLLLLDQTQPALASWLDMAILLAPNCQWLEDARTARHTGVVC